MDNDPVKHAFLRAIEQGADRLPPLDRRRRVAELLEQQQTPERVAEVLSLLEAHQSEGTFLDSSALADIGLSTSGLLQPDQPLPAGTRLGAFIIDSLLGAGGMGLVFKGRQEAPPRPVAIKIMRTPFLARGHSRRFTREAAVLARLQHPGIAQVYSAGVELIAGREVPYLAMELVEGRTLDEYLRVERPSIGARVELLARVTAAVAHAHQRGVLHRDLKPANIVVGTDANPKILDFGIARLVNQNHAGELAGSSAGGVPDSAPTLRGEILGTLAYMAPEQFEGDPERIDVRADVYALGVLLYESLSGTAPIAMDGLSIAAAARSVSAHEPRKLGTIDPSLRGDLENIAAKCLEKNPSERYQSASELLEDLHRHLRDEPILAKPATTLYRTRKFIRRNQAVTLLGVLVFLSMAVGLAATIWQARRAAAQTQATNQTNVFLKDILLAPSPSRARGQVVTMRMALDDASERLEKGAVTDQRVLSSLHGVLSQAYWELGVLDRAEAHMRSAIDVRRSIGGERSQDYLDGIGDLCTILYDAGKGDEVLRLAPPALQTARRTLEPDSQTTIRLITALAHASSEQDPKLAGALYAESVDRCTRALGPEHEQTLIAMNNLAIWSVGQGDYAKGEAVHRQLLDARTRKHGERHPDTIVSSRNVGSALLAQGRASDALPYLTKAVEVGDVVRGQTHPGQLSARVELAIALAMSGEHDRALTLLRDAIPRTSTSEGKATYQTVQFFSIACEILSGAGRFEECLLEAINARQAAAQAFGPESEDFRRTAVLERTAREGLGDFAAARRANDELHGMNEYEVRWELAPGQEPNSPPSGLLPARTP